MQESASRWQLGSNGESTIMISKQELILNICKKAGITRKSKLRRDMTKEELYKLNTYISTKCTR